MKAIPIGTKVQLSGKGAAKFFHCSFNYGFIARHTRNPDMLAVRHQGCKTVYVYHHIFWEVAKPL